MDVILAAADALVYLGSGGLQKVKSVLKFLIFEVLTLARDWTLMDS